MKKTAKKGGENEMRNLKASFLLVLLAMCFYGSSVLLHHAGAVMGNPSGMITLALRSPQPIPDPPAARLTVAMLASAKPGPWRPLASAKPGPWRPLASAKPGPWRPLASAKPGPWRPLASAKPGPWRPLA